MPITPPDDPDSLGVRSESRRSFLRVGAAAAATAFGGGCALFARKRETDVTLAPENGRVRLPLASYPALRDPGGSVVIEVSGLDERVLLFRRASGDLAAVSLTCTHLGCDVEYREDADKIACPCHGSQYDPWGRNLKGPAKEPLSSYPVRAEGGDVVITVS
jgi:Rieske Fe-S protein